MTDRIEAIRARWEKTTPGPWALDPDLWSPPSWGETMHYRRVVHGEPNEISGIRQPIFSTNGATGGSEQAAQNHHDAAAVAHAPEDIAYLLGEVERYKDAFVRANEAVTAREIEIERLNAALAPVAPDAEPGGERC